MKIGLMTTPWEHPADVARVAQSAEVRGIESIWVGEHSHLPVATEHAFSADTPEFYRRLPDPYVTLAAVATVTTTIRIGTAISLPAEHDPLPLAKTLATLDLLSGGRFEWGTGYGWNRLELVNRGVDPRHRMSRYAEVVRAVRDLWTCEIASAKGDHVRFSESWSWPKPVQQPHPPILLGCRAAPRAFGQLAAFCDGWMPSLTQAGEGLEADVAELRNAWDAAGRVGAPRITLIDSGFWADIDMDKFHRRITRLSELVPRLADLGAERLIVGMPMFRLDDVEQKLDVIAGLVPRS